MKFIFAGKERDIDVKYYAKLGGLMFAGLVGLTIFDLATDQVPNDPEYAYNIGEKLFQFIGLFITWICFAGAGMLAERNKKDEEDE